MKTFITELDRLGALLAECPPIGLAHYSLGCDDHSNAKSPRDKERSLEDLSTMLDMVYPALKQIEVVNPAVVLVENVPNFKASGAGAMMGTTLRRMGYFLTEMVLNGLDFGAYGGENAITWWRRSSPGSFHRNLSRELVDDCGR